MIHPLFRFLTTGSLLAVACLLPLPRPVQGFDNSAARQLATARQDSQAQPQVLTFPDLVTPQSLKSLDQLPKSAQTLELHFVEKPGSAHGPAAKDQIWMPARGDFKLRLKAGSSFAVLDPDGTDGEAVVQMPQNSLWEGFLQVTLSADKQAVASLKLADPLYYVNQELAGKDKTGSSKWWRVGLRSFPVAADWHGPDGADDVLSFSAQNVSAFHLVWVKSTASKPDFPVGVAEIGPEGGSIELPGVAEMHIPENIIDTPITFSMRQALTIPALVKENGFYGDYMYVGPAVDIKPVIDFKQSNQPIQLRINVDKNLLKSVDPFMLEYYSFFDKHQILKQPAQIIVDKKHPTLDSFFYLYYTGTFAPVFAKISVDKSKKIKRMVRLSAKLPNIQSFPKKRS